MSQFISSPVTPQGLEQQAGLSAIMQAEADRAVKERLHEDQMREAKLSREWAMADAAQARATQVREGDKNRQAQQMSQDKDIALQEKQLAAEQEQMAKSRQFQDAQRRASEAHAGWIMKQQARYDAEMRKIDARIAMADRSTALKLEKERARLQTKALRTQATWLAAQKALEGSQAQLTVANERFSKVRNDLVAANDQAVAIGSTAAKKALDRFNLNYKEAQSLRSTKDRAIAHLADIGTAGLVYSGKDKARMSGGGYGLNATSLAEAVGGGIEEAMREAGADPQKAAQAKAAVLGFVKAAWQQGEALKGSGGTPNETTETAFRQLQEAVQQAGISPATLHSLMTVVVNGLREQAGTTDTDGTGELKAEWLVRAANSLSSGLSALPRMDKDNLKVLEAAQEILRTGDRKAAERVIKDALEGDAEKEALRALGEKADAERGLQTGRQDAGRLQTQMLAEEAEAGESLAGVQADLDMQFSKNVEAILDEWPDFDIPDEPAQQEAPSWMTP